MKNINYKMQRFR